MAEGDYERMARSNASRGVKLRDAMAKLKASDEERAKLRAERDALQAKLAAASKPADPPADEKPAEAKPEPAAQVGGIRLGPQAGGMGHRPAQSDGIRIA